ncbi:efflux RND transporter permease subunit [Terricaulis silvestris]|uniref:Multidrug-efflux transporter MexB n=1 Tax=Terricaulis silvestris TaxID=2686094 RepID=A0A6I6MLK1_9CAUL|nr:efflux RND transporter permease subunit [Terricaulis silvestris]QGZ94086.1 Multidrug-efflux transporter MexB [Terricaulis silvestris]
MLKGLVAWWGRNPVAGNLLMLFCVLAGVFSFNQMEKEFWPVGRDDGVSINAVWPGASPEDMESQIIVRIEEATADLDNVDWVRSRSGESYGWVNLAADPGVDVDAMTEEVRSRVSSISGLPSGMEPIQVSRQVGRNWSIILGVHGDVPERTLRDTAERLRDRLSLLAGAANTIVVGVRTPEVSIEVSEASLQAWGLTFDEVSQAVRASSLNAGAGAVRTQDGNFQLQARNLADSELDFENIIVRQTSDGGIVRLRDVATVNDGFQDVNLYSRMNGEPSALVTVQTADRFNIWDTDKAVRETLEEIRSELPAGVQITTIYNEAEDYNALVGILLQNALQGFFLIFVLLLLTLHPKVAFWATLGVMTAFAGSFFILPYLDISLNFMSVFGFLLVLGIMVDDAIIVGEAVYERAERGHSGADASIMATQMVLKPLVASVFVTMIAFSPMMLLEGDVRQFTRAISIVVMSTLVFSLIESLIILPAHLAHVKKPDPQGTGILSSLMRVQQKCAHSVLWVAEHLHGPLVRGAVKARYLTWSIFLAILVLSIGLLATGRVKWTFMPEVEGDFMMASITLPQTTPFSRMEQVAAQLDAARRALEEETADYAVEDPNTGTTSRGVVRSWSQSIEENSIRAYVGLTPPEGRPRLRSRQVTERLEELLGEVPDADEISFSLSGSGSPSIELALMGENKEDLEAAVEELKARLLQFGDVTSVRDSQDAAIEELRFALLPGAEQLGITLGDITRQVRQAYFGEEVQRLPREGDDVRVYVRYPRDDRRTLESLGGFRVRTNDGREVPLASVATWEFAPGITGLDRRQRMSSILVTADLVNAEARQQIMNTLDSSFWPTFEAQYTTVSRRAIGEAEGQQEFMENLARLGLMALAAIYFLLAVTFRSYAQPIMILCVIPFAIVGALLGHLAFGTSFALFSVLGVIAAIGVVVNDNVVLVDRCNQIRGYFALREKHPGNAVLDEEEGWDPHEITLPNGRVVEYVGIAPDLEPHEEMITEGAESGFAQGPIELRTSAQMKWDSSEYRERAEVLEGMGFQVMRVKAERGITEASVSRFRQIFLTSVTEFVGTSPMILENAAIVQFLKPMVLSLAFGVLICMPATLILTPAFYMIGIDIKRGVLKMFGFYGRLYGDRRKLAAAE